MRDAMTGVWSMGASLPPFEGNWRCKMRSIDTFSERKGAQEEVALNAQRRQYDEIFVRKPPGIHFLTKR